MMTRLLRCKDSGSEDGVSWKLELLLVEVLEMMMELLLGCKVWRCCCGKFVVVAVVVRSFEAQ